MSWAKRNKWGLIFLVPSIVLALVGSSFYLVRIYMPWYSESTEHVTEFVQIPSSRTLATYPAGEEYTATLTPVGLLALSGEVVPERTSSSYFGTLSAPTGATLWQLITRVEADPNMVLSECSISLVGSDGTVYTTVGGKLVDGIPTTDLFGNGCTISGQPGPSVDLDGIVVPAEADQVRPESYVVSTYFALPESVVPASVRVSVGRSPSWTVPAPVR